VLICVIRGKKRSPLEKLEFGIFLLFIDNYLLPNILAKIQIIIAMIKITINIPNPIPALKMSPITSQLENENSITNTINNLSILFCMTSDVLN